MEVEKVVQKIKLLHSTNAETPVSFELTQLVLSRLSIDWSNPNLKILDPTCGRGTFLLALVKKLEEHGHTRQHIINNMIYGVDINPIQMMIATKALKMVCDTQSNVFCDNSLTRKWDNVFDLIVCSFPFNDDSKLAGRNVNKLKENTKSLDHEFYRSMIPLARNHAVTLRSNCLGKDSSVREIIFTDVTVKEIHNTSAYFDVLPGTMCVIRDEHYNSKTKTIFDRKGNSFTIETDNTTKLSLSTDAVNIEIIKKIWDFAKIQNMGSLWTRSPIPRHVKATTGTPCVDITGPEGKPVVVTRYNGDTSKVKHTNKWKVISNVNAPSASAIGAVKIVRPGTITSNSIVFFPFDTKEEALNCKAYLETQFIRWYTPLTKVSAGNSSEFFAKIPMVDFKRQITDDVLKEYFPESQRSQIWG
jgi:hypothetical protein